MEQITTAEIRSTRIVTPVVHPVKYDACTRGMTGAVQSHEQSLTYAITSSCATGENLNETEDSLGQTRQSRPAPDFTTIRIPT